MNLNEKIRLTAIADRLEADANTAEEYAKRQQAKRDKYSENPRGQKPASVGCLPLTIECMKRTVRELRQLLSEEGE